MSTVHKNLTGADLHEPKGADSALSGQVYVANGSGSGSWTDATSVITNSAFTTGDAKLTWKTTADTGWVMCNDGTIGDGSSGATTRANADTSSLFTLLWTNVSNTYAAVSGGRGASAAADFAAHKTIALPKILGRALVISGAGSGLTSRSLGETFGAESVVLSQGNLPNVNFSVTLSAVSGTITNGAITMNANYNTVTGGGTAVGLIGQNTGLGPTSWSTIFNVSQATSTFAFSSGSGTAASGGSGTAFNIWQPSSALQVMVKL